jgi:hypothetical protein
MNITLTMLSLFMGFIQNGSSPLNEKFQTNTNPTYTCGKLVWASAPVVMASGDFQGKATVSCDLDALSGGGFPELETFFISEVQTSATHIYSGPTYGTYQNMPSTSYDFDIKLTFSGAPAVARQTGTIATDRLTQLISQTQTKSVTGQGYSQYIKNFDLGFVVTPATPASTSANGFPRYHANITANIVVARPWYAPTDLFKTEVQKAIEGAVGSYQATIVQQIQNHL